MSPKVRKIPEKFPDEVLKEDLERYRSMALELGASDSRVIKTDQIIIDERVRMKCLYPKCGAYGTNANCPPYAPDLDTMRKVVKRFKYAVFFRVKVPSKDLVGSQALELRTNQPSQRKVYEIVSKIESTAFYEGHYLAIGLGAGPCKELWCPVVECSALNLGVGCRFPLKATGSMEGVGMDVFAMAARMGWDVYPCGAGVKPEDVPQAMQAGLVLIE